MSTHHSDPLAHPEVQQASAVRYIIGFGTTMILMLAALVITLQQRLPYVPFAESIAGLALLSLFSQAALFFGLDISRTQIWKSVSLVLTIPLFIITIGITVWMFNTLYARTMLPSEMIMTQPTLLQ